MTQPNLHLRRWFARLCCLKIQAVLPARPANVISDFLGPDPGLGPEPRRPSRRGRLSESHESTFAGAEPLPGIWAAATVVLSLVASGLRVLNLNTSKETGIMWNSLTLTISLWPTPRSRPRGVGITAWSTRMRRLGAMKYCASHVHTGT